MELSPLSWKCQAGFPEFTLSQFYFVVNTGGSQPVGRDPQGGRHMIMGGSPDDSEVIYLRTC